MNKIYNYFSSFFQDLTIKRANLFTTFVIFIFSIVFATLLIKENYHEYRLGIQQEKEIKEFKDKNILNKTAKKIDAFVSHKKFNDENIRDILEVFKSDVDFIKILKSKDDRLCLKNMFCLNNPHVEGKIYLKVDLPQKSVLMYLMSLSNGEELVLANFEDVEVSQPFRTQNKHKSILIKNTLTILTLVLIFFIIAVSFYKIFSAYLQRDTQMFLDFFEDASNNYRVINPNAIHFKDFQIMVGYANKMVETISEQKYILKNVNKELEDKVRRKTRDLEQINENLIREKKFSEDIINSQKNFLRYAVHETNTPLSVILASIELFVMKNQKDRHLSKIEAAVKNIFNIYDDLSYLVKKDQIEYPKIVINLATFLKSRIEFFAEVAELSRIKFRFVTYTEDMFVYFNETKLQRIVDNTITNAIKYTLPNEMVHVEIKQVGSFVEMSMGSRSKVIKDTDRIFDAYYREEENRDGFGLGLKLVRSICDEEGVKILLSSDDKRTTFSYRFKKMGK